MACFADINVSQGSVATHAKCGGILNIHLTANLPGNLQWKISVNRLRFDRIVVVNLWPRFFDPPCMFTTPFHRWIKENYQQVLYSSVDCRVPPGRPVGHPADPVATQPTSLVGRKTANERLLDASNPAFTMSRRRLTKSLVATQVLKHRSWGTVKPGCRLSV